MTTTTMRGHYRFTDAARMEWVKLRSLRSTWWTLAVTIAAAAGIAVAVGANTENATGDLTNNALAGIALGLLLVGVLGVLAMTGEYSSGTIRSTLVAVPNRPLALAAKATVFGALALAAGEAAAFIAFFAGGAALPAAIPAPTLGQPGVLRAVVLGGAGYCLIGLLGLGFGAVVRHTALAVGLLVGGVYVVAQLVAGRRAGTFSLGMAQRLGIAAALLGDPEVLLLDEPVNGLDPEGIRWVRDLLRSLAAEGRTVFVSSHLIGELSRTADHVVVIGRGRLLADTSVADLAARSASLEDAFLELTS